jgi:hypothetical protein
MAVKSAWESLPESRAAIEDVTAPSTACARAFTAFATVI